MSSLMKTLLCVLLLLPSLALAHTKTAEEGDRRAWPERHLLDDWDHELVAGVAGERFVALIETEDERPVTVQLFDGERWLDVAETFRAGETAVLQLDFAETLRRFQLRSDDAERILFMEWSIVDRQLEAHGPPPPLPGVLPQELIDIGVISRSSWGASPTNCESTEDNWYRMAIHHTAGNQTGGGSVQGAAQAVQAYTMGEGFCDVPYQFLVGYDGSLWEGRPYDYYSGATGGGNNDGNIAISFMGCYDASACNVGPHPATDDMMEAANLLVQTLVAMHSIPSDSNSIRGHKNWPGNSTSCPGSYVLDRFDELLEPLGAIDTAELVGYIRHTDLLEPSYGITGAKVEVLGQDEMTADATGFYTFTGLSPATYTICAEAPGYLDNCREKAVELDSVNWGSILLEREPGDDDDASDDDDSGDDDDSSGDDDDSGDDDAMVDGERRLIEDDGTGCGCAVKQTNNSNAATALLFLLAAWWRRLRPTQPSPESAAANQGVRDE